MKYIGTIITLVFIVVISWIYNSFVKERNKVHEDYSSMDILLKKRWDLIPNLVQVVKGYSIYEENTLNKLTSLRSDTFNKLKMEQKLDIDRNISNVVFKMMAIAENYPDLKADKEYTNLSNQLVKLEDEISNSRKEYNNSVRAYNTTIQVFPKNLIAILFGFNEEKLFE